MRSVWNDLTDNEKLAHNAAVCEAADRLIQAEKTAKEARRYLTPGSFPATWKEDSFLAVARAADAALRVAEEAHNDLLYRYSDVRRAI